MSTENTLRGWRRFSPAAVLGASLLLLVAASEAHAKPLTADPSYAAICERMAIRLPRLHLLHLEMGDMVSSRTWTNLLVSIDYEHLYFLQSDIDRFRTRETKLDNDLKAGDMGFAFDVFEVYKARLSNRVDFVNATLQAGFDWTQSESYVWQRKDSPWPANETEWDDLWRRKIKNEYVRLLINRESESATNAVATNALPTVSASVSGTNMAMLGALDTNGVVGATGLVAVAAAAFTGVVAKVESPETVISNRYHQSQVIIDDCDAEWVLQRYMNAFAQAYDPHSSYFTPSAMADFEIEMNLSLFGIGALLSSEDGAAKIVRLIPGGPAAHDTRDNRLQPGDKIIGVAQDGAARVDILHWPLNKIVGLIRGEKGTRVVLTVIPASDSSGTVTKTVDLVRDEVKLEDEAAKGTLRSVTDTAGHVRKLGIIRLPAFYGNMHVHSPEEPGFRSAVFDVLKILHDFKQQKVDGLLLDLRSNGGGALAEAIDMTGLFIRKGPTVQVKENFGIRALDDEDPRVSYDGPLVVLVNRLSASASEILAGALQDYGRALIVGDSKTHGKGTVQSVVSLGNDDSMGSLKITTASYIRITGAATQLHGILPDIVVPSPWDFMETGEEFLPNPVPWSLERPADFRRVADLGPVVPHLRELSETRRRQDQNFQTYARFLERIVQMNETKALPLNLKAREQLAETEKEMSDLQDRLTSEGGDVPPDEAASAADLVLKEGLAILADFVNVREASASSSDTPVAPVRQSVSTW